MFRISSQYKTKIYLDSLCIQKGAQLWAIDLLDFYLKKPTMDQNVVRGGPCTWEVRLASIIDSSSWGSPSWMVEDSSWDEDSHIGLLTFQHCQMRHSIALLTLHGLECCLFWQLHLCLLYPSQETSGQSEVFRGSCGRKTVTGSGELQQGRERECCCCCGCWNQWHVS